jgi:hypothetical protein
MVNLDLLPLLLPHFTHASPLIICLGSQKLFPLMLAALIFLRQTVIASLDQLVFAVLIATEFIPLPDVL